MMTQPDWILLIILACVWTGIVSLSFARLWRSHDAVIILVSFVLVMVVTVGLGSGLIALLKDTCL